MQNLIYLDEQQQYSLEAKRREVILFRASFLPILRQETSETRPSDQPWILASNACYGGVRAALHEGAIR